MIEYLFNAIRAVAGEEITVAAKITDESGALITNGCSLMLHLNDKEVKVEGAYYSDIECWQFVIPAEATVGYNGRFWYCFKQEGANLCFDEPIYLVGGAAH